SGNGVDVHKRNWRPPEERFLASVDKQASGCWSWQGSGRKRGCPYFWDGKRPVPARVWAYERWVGDMPKGHKLDRCEERLCVSPAHVTLVSDDGRHFNWR